MPLSAVRSVYTVINDMDLMLASRDMGSHGSVATFADPENNLFQLHVRADGGIRGQ
jgi:hypothetical protein